MLPGDLREHLVLLLHLLSLHLHLLLAYESCVGLVVVALSLELGVSVGRLDKVRAEWVHVPRVVQVVNHELRVLLMDALVV